MSNSSDSNNASKTSAYSADMLQMMDNSTNATIMKAFLAKFFAQDTRFNCVTIFTMVRNLAAILVIKNLLEESKSYFEKFKFTDMNFFKYAYQWARLGETRYQIMLVDNRWKFGLKVVSINNLTPFMESKFIHLSQPGTYYYTEKTYLFKVIVAPTCITFAVPAITSIQHYMEDEVIHQHQEILYGGKTAMAKATMIPGSSSIRIEPVQLSHAFETDNYKILKDSIQHYFLVDTAIQFPAIPFCVNFNGKPGTGKTTFASYIATKGIFERVINFNMVQATGVICFQDLMITLERQISSTSKKPDAEPEKILLILDEMDKWLETYISNRIDKLREDARTSSQNNFTTNDNQKDSRPPTMYQKLTKKEEAEKRIHLKNEFLDQLYKLVDGHLFSDVRKYVIIFNTNHFLRLFENADKRYLALHDRFQRYTFDKNGRYEIIAFLEAISNRMKTFTDDPEVPQHKKDLFGVTGAQLCCDNKALYAQIPDDIEISCRTLWKILRANCFRIEATIQTLCSTQSMGNYKEFDSETYLIEDKVESDEEEVYVDAAGDKYMDDGDSDGDNDLFDQMDD